GDGPRMPQIDFNPKFLGGGLGLILGLVAVAWLASGFYIVDASQRGLVLQFGSYKESTEPGLRWRFPYPFQSHELVNLSGVRTLEIGYRGSQKNKVLKEALMLTDDENIVNIQFAVQYILKDPVEYLFNNRSTDEAVMGAAESALREIVGKSKMNFVLYEGREQIATEAAQLMQTILDRYKSGILISKVTMQNAQPPEQVQAAFDDAVKAGQDLERQKNEGQAYANDVIPKARGTAARLMEEANGHKQRVIATAEGDASRFKQVQVEYAKAPEVTRQRMYLETMEQVYANTSKVLVDAKGQGNLLYLPLDKLMQGAAGVTAAQIGAADNSAGLVANRTGGGISSEVPPQLERPVGAGSSSSLRSRDREGR
ncbi:MAG: FtsH protease activity modulator HflK, partial [Azonexus sp.]|nr:FtsH protease activity modulator HflK [Azonexus sp.]